MTQARTIRDVIERLCAMQNPDENPVDSEDLHNEADMLLLDALLIAGHGAVVDAWLGARRRVCFYYA